MTKISELEELGTVADDDLLVVVDTSAGVTKRAPISALPSPQESGASSGAFTPIQRVEITTPVASVEFTEGFDDSYIAYLMLVDRLTHSSSRLPELLLSSDGGETYHESNYREYATLKTSFWLGANSSFTTSTIWFSSSAVGSRPRIHASSFYNQSDRVYLSNSAVELEAASGFSAVKIRAAFGGQWLSGRLTLYGVL